MKVEIELVNGDKKEWTNVTAVTNQFDVGRDWLVIFRNGKRVDSVPYREIENLWIA